MLERSGYGLAADFDRRRARIALGCGMFAPMTERFGAFLQNRRALQRLRHLPAFQALGPTQQADLLAQLAAALAPDAQAPTADASLGFSSQRTPGRIANRLNLRGGYTAIASSCASSAIAILEAVRWLQNGECDLALAGGTDYSMLTALGQIMFSATQAVTRGECRPFDQAADGTLGGIGCGLVLLKRLDDARRDGNPIQAVLLGGAMSADGRGTSMTLPLLEGVLRAMEGAVHDAGVTFADISYVEAHGTGAPAGDAMELEALARMIAARGAPPTGLALGALKQIIGHTHAAAGAAALIKVILAFRHKAFPPIRHIRAPRDFLTAGKGVCYYREELTPWAAAGAPRRALINTLGFGGINCCLVVQEP
jgi:acyl transferase domain-containing protein